MEFILIIIIAVIVSVVSAAMKKKPKSSGEDDAPVRSTMSDIQRAFRMATDAFDENPDAPQPYNTPPAPKPVTPSVVPSVTRAAPTVAPTVAPAVPSVAPTTPTISETYAGYFSPTAANELNPFSDMHAGAYFMEEEKKEELLLAASSRKRANAPRLKLFADKSEFVKAVIYSEILPRKH